jgi:hypothetical protein
MTAAPSGKAQKREIPSSLSAWPTQRSEWVGPTTSSVFYLYRASPSLPLFPCAPLLPSPYLSCSSSCPLLCLSLYTTRVQGGGKIFFLFGLLAAKTGGGFLEASPAAPSLAPAWAGSEELRACSPQVRACFWFLFFSLLKLFLFGFGGSASSNLMLSGSLSGCRGCGADLDRVLYF